MNHFFVFYQLKNGSEKNAFRILCWNTRYFLTSVIVINVNIGPHGCGNVFGRNVHICRRIIWIVILLFGLLYTFNVISINALKDCFNWSQSNDFIDWAWVESETDWKYFDFPSSLKPVLSNSSTIHYPSLVICHNSMHSNQGWPLSLLGMGSAAAHFFGINNIKFLLLPSCRA